MFKRFKLYLEYNDGYWIDIISDFINFLFCRKGCKWAKNDYDSYTGTFHRINYTCKRCGCHTTSDKP